MLLTESLFGRVLICENPPYIFRDHTKTAEKIITSVSFSKYWL